MIHARGDATLTIGPYAWGGSRIFEKGGVQIRSTSKKGGPDGGPILGPMLKSLHHGTKGGGPDPLDPPPPGSALAMEAQERVL